MKAAEIMTSPELERQPWFGLSGVKMEVKDGIVHYEGVVTDLRTRDALIVAAQKVSGNPNVETMITVVEPNTGTVLEL